MQTIPLGRNALLIPRIGLGCTTFGREIDEKTSWDIIDFSISRGINLLDTGEAYGGGNARLNRQKAYKVDDVREVSGEMHSSEKIIGRWLQNRRCRERVMICTKFNTGGTPDRVRQSLRDSLERLQIDYVEIYMLHRPFPDVPIRETLEALTAEVQAGRIRTIGCSNFSTELLREAQETAEKYGLTRMDSVQPPFSLADIRARATLLPYCMQHEIATTIYSPLAAGFLTGKYSQGGPIPKGTRFDVAPPHADIYFSPRNFQVVEKLRELSAEIGEPMSKLAMAWVFGQPGVSSVLVGARQLAHIDNGLEAFNQPLSAAVKTRMDAWIDEK